MKARILQENLVKALSVVERATAKNPTLPILGTIAVVATKNGLEFSSTDLELGVRYSILAKTEKEGGVAVPARLFTQFAGLLGEREVQLNATAAGLRIDAKGRQTTIKTLPLDDFPILPSLAGEEKAVEFDAQELRQALAQVVGMTGQNQARPEISGVLFSLKQEEARLAATDSFRLAEKILPLKKGQEEAATAIFPRKTAHELAAVLADAEGKVKLYLSPSQALLEYASLKPGGESWQLVSRLLEGEYPQYQDVIPGEFAAKATAAKADLLSAIRAASVFAGKLQDVRLSVDPKKKGIELTAESSEVGKHSSQVGAAVSGKALEISFNWKFLLEGIANIKGEDVEMGFAGNDAPAVLRPASKEQYLYVVMPVKA